MKKMNTKGYNSSVIEILLRLNVGSQIEADLLENVFNELLSEPKTSVRDVQLGSILTGLMARGPKSEEVTSLLKAAFRLDNFDLSNKYKIRLPGNQPLVGAIGSGKKGIKTMNISTPALITAASVGIYTIKLAFSSTSSLTGSFDFLREVGVNLAANVEDAERMVTSTHFGAFTAGNLFPNFDSLYAKRFYVPHALSFGLAALSSPINYDTFIYGLAHSNVDLSIDVLNNFGVKNVLVASTTNDNIHYLDEVGIYGITKLKGIRNGQIGKTTEFDPVVDLGLPKYTPTDIAQGSSVHENVKYVVDALAGKGESAREDIIAINAGAVIYLANKARDLKEGYEIAKDALKGSMPLKKLIEVVEESKGDKNLLERYI